MSSRAQHNRLMRQQTRQGNTRALRSFSHSIGKDIGVGLNHAKLRNITGHALASWLCRSSQMALSASAIALTKVGVD